MVEVTSWELGGRVDLVMLNVNRKTSSRAVGRVRGIKINALRPIPVGTQVSPCAPRTHPSGRC
jgi:hypothetical protein